MCPIASSCGLRCSVSEEVGVGMSWLELNAKASKFWPFWAARSQKKSIGGSYDNCARAELPSYRMCSSPCVLSDRSNKKGCWWCINKPGMPTALFWRTMASEKWVWEGSMRKL